MSTLLMRCVSLALRISTCCCKDCERVNKCGKGRFAMSRKQKCLHVAEIREMHFPQTGVCNSV